MAVAGFAPAREVFRAAKKAANTDWTRGYGGSFNDGVGLKVDLSDMAKLMSVSASAPATSYSGAMLSSVTQNS